MERNRSSSEPARCNAQRPVDAHGNFVTSPTLNPCYEIPKKGGDVWPPPFRRSLLWDLLSGSSHPEGHQLV